MRFTSFAGVLVVGMFSVRRVLAFAPRAGTTLRHTSAASIGWTNSLTGRWMSSDVDVNEKTEEEKEALKAIREERK